MAESINGVTQNPFPSGAFSVTTSDTADLSQVAYGLYVGTSGNIAVLMANGDSVTFKNVAASTFMPIAVKRVLATNTTASDILGFK